MWGNDHVEALEQVFEALNANLSKWMILRNYEGLPQKNRSKDIDLLLEKKDFKESEKVISSALESKGFSRLLKESYQYVWCLTFFKIKKDKVISIKIDLLDGFVWRGAQLIDFTELYNRKVAYDDFFVPDPVYDGFMLWLKPLLTGGFIKDKYREDIHHTIVKHPEEFYNLLELIFFEKEVKKVWFFLSKGNLDKTTSLQTKLCYSAWVKVIKRERLNTIYATVEHFYKEIIRRSIKPKGSFISVAGPDGVGKTTFLELLQEELVECLVKEKDDVRIVHFRPNIIPNIKKLLNGKLYDESKEDFTNPHREKPVNGLNALLRITYYWIDYVLGYWFKTRPQCAKGRIYIYDRYFYDFIIDPFRSKINLPKWVRVMYWKAIPKPDLIFFLECEAKVIYKRKQELTLEEIKRQLQEYKELADNSSRFIILNATKYPQEICQEAIKYIVEMNSEKL